MDVTKAGSTPSSVRPSSPSPQAPEAPKPKVVDEPKPKVADPGASKTEPVRVEKPVTSDAEQPSAKSATEPAAPEVPKAKAATSSTPPPAAPQPAPEASTNQVIAERSWQPREPVTSQLIGAETSKPELNATAPSVAYDAAIAARDRAGRRTANDGRADNLREAGGHRGARDEDIEATKRSIAEIQQATGAGATPESRQAQVDLLEAKLADLRRFNFLADVAHVTSMPTELVDVIEGSTSVQLGFVDGTVLGSDAEFNSATGSITVDRLALAGADEDLRKLVEAGIADADGNILDTARFDSSEFKNRAISGAALILHEVTHVAQQESGAIEAAARLGGRYIDAAKAKPASTTAMPKQTELERAYAQAEVVRVAQVEYLSYLNQESVELQAGKLKQVFTTIKPDGTFLPRDEAVANIIALQTGEPMRFGASAGLRVGGDPAPAPESAAVQLTVTDDLPTGADDTGGRNTGGDDTGGRNTGGDDTGGRNTGGDDTGGRNTGGDGTGGRNTGGDGTGGRNTGGDDTGGRNTGGDDTGGRNTGGDDTGGRNTGGEGAGGRRTGGVLTDGEYTSKSGRKDGEKSDKSNKSDKSDKSDKAVRKSVSVTSEPAVAGGSGIQPWTQATRWQSAHPLSRTDDMALFSLMRRFKKGN